MKATVGMKMIVWPNYDYRTTAEVVYVTENFVYSRCTAADGQYRNCEYTLYSSDDAAAAKKLKISWWFQESHETLFSRQDVFKILPPESMPTTEFGDDT